MSHFIDSKFTHPTPTFTGVAASATEGDLRARPDGCDDPASGRPPIGDFGARAPRRRRFLAVAAGLLMVAAQSFLLIAGVSSAEAQTVQCGQVLTTSVTVANNLRNCRRDGLVIGASDITVDLNGKTIDGAGLGAGIRNDGYDDVTIKNGTVKEFDYGVQLNPGTLRNTVQELNLTLNQDAAIQLSDADGNSIISNTITQHPEQGIVLLNGSTQNLIADNTIDWTQGISLLLVDSGSITIQDGKTIRDGNTIQDNRLSNGSDRGVVFTASSGNSFLNNTLSDMGDTGLSLEAGSNWNTVMNNNTFTRTGDSGVSVVDSNNNSFESNTVDEPGDAGLRFTQAHDNQILKNTVRGASDCAIFLESSNGNTIEANILAVDIDAGEKPNTCGIDLAHSDGNSVTSNIASNTLTIGINLEASSNNQITNNIASGNKAEGIVVGDTDVGANLIDGNTTISNLGDGIVVANGGHTISNNTAKTNDGWGIYAAAGNTDGGGNLASGNTEPAQCLGVVCYAAPVSCGTTVVVSADADSWIAEDNVNSNFGTDSILKVRSKGPANDFRALVRFSLPPMPAGCPVVDAKLQLYAASATTGRTIQALQVAGGWNESDVTWTTQPWTTGVAATTASGLGTLEWSVTNQVQAMYLGSNNGFLIRDAAEDDVASPEQSFHGHEKNSPPALVIMFHQ